jgi:hypothetical protein
MKAIAWLIPPAPPDGPLPLRYVKNAERAYQIAMFLVDLCGFGLLAMLGASLAQLGVYASGGLLLFPVLYDRLDLLLGILLLLALALLLKRVPYAAALAVLAVAINFKMTPLVLVPVFVMGTLPVEALRSKSRIWLLAGKRLVLLGLLGVAVIIPFLLEDAAGALGFLGYHAKRGLEIASVWNTLPIALGAAIGWPVRASLSFGAVELTSPISGVLRALSSICTTAVIPVLALALWKLSARRAGRLTGGRTLAQTDGAFVTRYAIVSLLTAVVVAPVLSPQYFLWLTPLMPLWDGNSRRYVWLGFLAICALTTVHYPFFTGNVLGALTPEDGLSLPARLFWTAPLILRNILLVAYTAWLWKETLETPAANAPSSAA